MAESEEGGPYPGQSVRGNLDTFSRFWKAEKQCFFCIFVQILSRRIKIWKNSDFEKCSKKVRIFSRLVLTMPFHQFDQKVSKTCFSLKIQVFAVHFYSKTLVWNFFKTLNYWSGCAPAKRCSEKSMCCTHKIFALRRILLAERSPKRSSFAFFCKIFCILSRKFLVDSQFDWGGYFVNCVKIMTVHSIFGTKR